MTITPLVFKFIITICSLLTAAISATTGMGGGVLLLSILSLFIGFDKLIPIHGFIQLISNSSRCFLLRKNIYLKFLIPFCLGAPLGFMLVIYILEQFDLRNFALSLIVILIFYSLFKPKKLPSFAIKSPYFFFVGFFAGILGMLVGATGPFLACFFIRDDLDKKQIVATKSVLQLIIHLFKIPSFLYIGFNYFQVIDLLIFASIATIIGTNIGVKLLDKLDETKFKLIFKSLLLVASFRLILKIFDVV